MAQTLRSKVLSHFDLRRRRKATPATVSGDVVVVGGPSGARRRAEGSARQEIAWMASTYVASLLGVLGKQVWDDVNNRQSLGLSVPTVVTAVIVSAVTFPTLYRGLEAQNERKLRIFVSFQYGFFWQSILGEVGAHLTPMNVPPTAQ